LAFADAYEWTSYSAVMEGTQINIKSLASLINRQEHSIPYHEMLMLLDKENQAEISSDIDGLNALLDILVLRFDPREKSYPFSSKIQSAFHHEFIEQLLEEVTHPDVVWLLRDLFWTNHRQPENAKIAAEHACKSANALEVRKYSLEILQRMERALVLAGQSRDESAKEKVIDDLKILAQKSLSVSESFLPIWLLRLLINVKEHQFLLEMEESAKIANMATEAETVYRWDIAQALRQLSIDILRSNKLEEKAQKAIFALAYSFRGEASRSIGMKSVFTYQKAVQALQKINQPSLLEEKNAQIEELQILLQQSQLDMRKALKEITINPYDTTPHIKSLETVLNTAKSFEEALLLLAARFPLHNEEKMKSDIREYSKNLIHLVFAKIQNVDERGRTIQQPITADDHLAMLINKELDICWGLIGNIVEQGRKWLNAKYSVTESDWIRIIIANPYIPDGHHEIIAKGLHQGFNGEWLESTHLLPPQIEASLKYILELHLNTSQNIMLGGKQKDLSLKDLLLHIKMPLYINEDFCFEASRLLTEDGLNLRNNEFHGKMNFLSFYTYRSIYLWYLSIKFFCFGSYLLSPNKTDE
jgi:hypothetical protein